MTMGSGCMQTRREQLRLAVHVSPGQVPPLAFCHGLGGTHRYWETQDLRNLFPNRLILPDLFGFGASPQPWLRYTLDRHLALLRHTFRGQPPMILVGHSLGAALALAYAARFPSHVRGLVLLSLPYFSNERSAYRWFRRSASGWVYTNMAAMALSCMFTRRVAGRLLPFVLKEFPVPVVEDLVLHNMFSSTTSLWEVLYRTDLRLFANQIPDIPVSCVHGDTDTTAPVAMLKGLAENRKNWQVHVLEDIDHHPWLFAPDECIEVIREATAGLAAYEPTI